jgi:hypothetical protein
MRRIRQGADDGENQPSLALSGHRIGDGVFVGSRVLDAVWSGLVASRRKIVGVTVTHDPVGSKPEADASKACELVRLADRARRVPIRNGAVPLVPRGSEPIRRDKRVPVHVQRRSNRDEQHCKSDCGCGCDQTQREEHLSRRQLDRTEQDPCIRQHSTKDKPGSTQSPSNIAWASAPECHLSVRRASLGLLLVRPAE